LTTASRPGMRRFLFTAPLQPTALEVLLPAHSQRLALHLNAPQSGHITRAESTALWRALREQEKTQPALKYYLALHAGALSAGEPACWLGLTAAANTHLLDAARVFDALLRQHIPLFAAAQTTATLDTTPLLHDLEHRKGWRVAFVSGELELLREQLKTVTVEQLADFPHLRLARIWLMCKDARLHDAEKEWGTFRVDLGKGRYPDLPGWEVGLVRELVADYNESAATPARHAYLERLVQQIPLNEPDLIGIAHNSLCYLALESGDLTRALAAADAAEHAYTRAGSGYGNLFIHYHRGIALMSSGQLLKARRSYRKGLALSRQQTISTRELPAIGHALLAGLEYLGNQIAAATQMLETALTAIEQGESWSHLLWLVYRTFIQLAALEHNPSALERALQHTRQVARMRGFKRLDTQLALLEIEIDLRRGAVDAARVRARRIQMGELAQRPIERDLRWRHTIFHARYLLLLLRLPHAGSGERQQAQWLAHEARRLHDFELRVHALLLCAQMDLQSGERERAFTAMDEVLGLLLPERPLRVLLDHPGIAVLLAEYRRAARHRQTARRVQGWLGELERAARDDARLARSHAHRLTLTVREMDILHELAQGCRNKEIAQRLKCSENTVKFHLKRLNRKFSTHKRGELAARAREAGVLG